MRAALHFLLIAVLALFVAGAGSAGSAGPVLDAASGHSTSVEMPGCADCPDEEMHAGAQPCGWTCGSPALVVLADAGIQPAAEPAASFPTVHDEFAGQSRPPEPAPPRVS